MGVLRGRPETAEQIADRYWRHDLNVNAAEAPHIRCDEIITASPLVIWDQFN
jgi:hypothetical protein